MLNQAEYSCMIAQVVNDRPQLIQSVVHGYDYYD